MKALELKQQFPELNDKVYGKDLVYFDNAATSQRLQSVIDFVNNLEAHHNANIHRAVHLKAVEATDFYENTRNVVKEYINASSREEIVFTSGDTASINLVAYSFGEVFISEGDEILVGEAEHHSNLVPWQLLAERKGAKVVKLPLDEDGNVDLAVLESLLSSRTKLLAIGHISNVLGIVNPIKEIVSVCHSHGVPVLVDGAQGIVHTKIDVQDLDCDFYTFSGHKIYASTGTGVLYGKREWLEKMTPFLGGGEMISRVSFEGTTYASLPYKFEAGTQNFNAMPSLIPALEWLGKVLYDEELSEDNSKVCEYLMSFFLSQEAKYMGIKLYGVPRGTNEKVSIFSFTVDGVHHGDLALILDKMGIATRSGQMCAEPLMDKYSVTGMLRISLAPFNTIEEAEYFVVSLKKAIDMLR